MRCLPLTKRLLPFETLQRIDDRPGVGAARRNGQVLWIVHYLHQDRADRRGLLTLCPCNGLPDNPRGCLISKITKPPRSCEAARAATSLLAEAGLLLVSRPDAESVPDSI